MLVLTINTARFPEEKAVELVATAAAVLGYRRRARRPTEALAPADSRLPAPVETVPPPVPADELAEVGAGV